MQHHVNGGRRKMKVRDVVEVTVGIAAPVVLVSAVMGSAPVAGGAALTWALKRLGFGVAKRGFVTLAATGAVSGKAAGLSEEYIENKAKEIIREHKAQAETA